MYLEYDGIELVAVAPAAPAKADEPVAFRRASAIPFFVLALVPGSFIAAPAKALRAWSLECPLL